ncbi:hypothetical protein PAMP_012645 [Pampus punctatissimus]
MLGGRTTALTRPMRGREKSEQVDIGSLEPWSGISPTGRVSLSLALQLTRGPNCDTYLNLSPRTGGGWNKRQKRMKTEIESQIHTGPFLPTSDLLLPE